MLPGKPARFFSLSADEHVRSVLGEHSKKQIIFEAETLSAVLACILWGEHIAHRRCFLFVDNEGTKFALLKGFAENAIVDHLAEMFVEWEVKRHSLLWISRVASASNIADAPSRNDLEHPLLRNAIDDSNKANALLSDVT